MLDEQLQNLRQTKPLIHSITNYVTANDCANILLACGASPIMSDDIHEVEEITSISNGLNLNLGTLSEKSIASMLLASKRANFLNHPIVLDPVGVGASSFRTTNVLHLLDQFSFTVIKGNISEIKTLVLGNGTTQGVDASADDQITTQNLAESVGIAKQLSKRTNSIVVITGTIDIVTDSETTYCIHNGHPMMSRVTGTGCQLSAVITAFLAANPDTKLESVVAAVCAMGLCGEKAYLRMSKLDGNMSYRNYLIDKMFTLTGQELKEGAKYDRY